MFSLIALVLAACKQPVLSAPVLQTLRVPANDRRTLDHARAA